MPDRARDAIGGGRRVESAARSHARDAQSCQNIMVLFVFVFDAFGVLLGEFDALVVSFV